MVSLIWSDANGNKSQLVIDATVSDTHTTTATPTEHPVEKGVAITDHVRPGPLKLSLECVITNTPLDIAPSNKDSFTDGVTRSQGSQALQVGSALLMQVPAMGPIMPALFLPQAPPNSTAQTWQFSAAFDRVKKVYEALVAAQQGAYQIEVDTTLANYTSMIITNISAPRTNEMGSKAIKFTMDFQQIRTVESQTVALPAPAAQPQHKGHKPTTQESDSSKATVLHNLVAAAAKAF
jgi:Dit-like tail protein